jgi:hypothetical protein
MRTISQISIKLTAVLLVAAAFLLTPLEASAHCDTMNGPVVADARQALESGHLTPVLKWVTAADESEIAVAFEQARVVRQSGHAARELADMYFFETVVRVHRASEGVAYTGLKPASTDVGPAITAADEALKTGSVDHLVDLLKRGVQAAVQERFTEAHAALQHADHSVEAGRKFVNAYVLFTHLAEELHEATTHAMEEHAAASGTSATSAHPNTH